MVFLRANHVPNDRNFIVFYSFTVTDPARWRFLHILHPSSQCCVLHLLIPFSRRIPSSICVSGLASRPDSTHFCRPLQRANKARACQVLSIPNPTFQTARPLRLPRHAHLPLCLCRSSSGLDPALRFEHKPDHIPPALKNALPQPLVTLEENPKFLGMQNSCVTLWL